MWQTFIDAILYEDSHPCSRSLAAEFWRPNQNCQWCLRWRLQTEQSVRPELTQNPTTNWNHFTKTNILSRLYRKFHCCCHIVERIGPLLLPKCSSFVPFFMAPQISYLQSCQKTTIGRERRRMWLVHILLMGKLRSKYGSISSTYPVTPSNCPQIRNGKKCDIVHTWGMV